ncbi:MAG: EF-P lysine aminoacylase GenX [Gammaproteobacteria bacterium]|nr:EF-P lysine aminoacylase GenX [Gammaproteobacteria bacterium]
MPTDKWRPSAAISVLRQRAEILQRLRSYFAERQVLEVETPALSHAASSEVHLQTMQVHANGMLSGYLHTSPELAMKRLLAAGSGDIYQMCKVFRAGEQGKRHNPEFTLLEWYRVGYDMQAMMHDVAGLCVHVLPALFNTPPLTLSYREAFLDYAQIDPFIATTAQLAEAYVEHTQEHVTDLERDAWLDLIQSVIVQPCLPRDRLVFITGFPAAQASLAKLDASDPQLACRFEVFAGGLELANGFEELTDAREQQQRITAEQARRAAMGLARLPVDQHFLAALQAGLPACSGVAVGVDRLVMLGTGQTEISGVLSFEFDRA